MANLKSIAYIIIVGTGLCEAARAQAAQMTVGDLYKFCTSSDDGDKNACRFYILGVFEGVQIGGAAVLDKTGSFQEATDKRFCVPEGLASSAMELTVKMKMGADIAVYPQDRALPAVSFITAIIAQQFPCHKPK